MCCTAFSQGCLFSASPESYLCIILFLAWPGVPRETGAAPQHAGPPGQCGRGEGAPPAAHDLPVHQCVQVSAWLLTSWALISSPEPSGDLWIFTASADLSDVFSLGSNLLESKADGIEVSYNACGVLSHIMFDGLEAWGICEPHREEVVKRMWAAIQSWDINSRRNINYRWAMEKTGTLTREPELSQEGNTNREKGRERA